MWVLLFRSVMLTLTVIGFLDLREFSFGKESRFPGNLRGNLLLEV